MWTYELCACQIDASNRMTACPGTQLRVDYQLAGVIHRCLCGWMCLWMRGAHEKGVTIKMKR